MTGPADRIRPIWRAVILVLATTLFAVVVPAALDHWRLRSHDRSEARFYEFHSGTIGHCEAVRGEIVRLLLTPPPHRAVDLGTGSRDSFAILEREIDGIRALQEKLGASDFEATVRRATAQLESLRLVMRPMGEPPNLVYVQSAPQLEALATTARQLSRQHTIAARAGRARLAAERSYDARSLTLVAGLSLLAGMSLVAWIYRSLRSTVKAWSEAEARTEESERRHAALVAASFDLVAETHEDFTLVGVNEGFKKVFGIDGKTIVGRNTLEFAAESDVERIKALAEKTKRTGNPIRFTARGNTSTGETRWFDVNTAPIVAADGSFRFLSSARDITEQRQIEERLRFQAQVIDQIHDAVIATDLEGIVTSWNRGAERLLGYDPAEMLGKHISHIYPKDQHGLLESDVIAPLKRKEMHEIVVRMLRKSGEEFSAHLLLSMLKRADGEPLGMIGYSMDITERLRAEERLQESEIRFRALTEHANDLVYELDANGILLYANPRSSELLGYDEGEIVGNPFTEFVHPDDRKTIISASMEVLRGNLTERPVIRIQKKSGDWLWIEGTAKRFETPSGSSHVVAVARDVSRQLELVAEHEKLQAQLRQIQKLDSLGGLAGGIAHDVNNVLGIILINAERATKSLPAESSSIQRLQRIKEASIRASRFVHQLLAYAGRGDLPDRRVDLAKIVEDTRRLIETAVPPRIRLQFDLPEDAQIVVADPGQIEQVIVNLVTNAIEAVGDEVGEITVRTGSSDLNAEQLRSTVLGGDLAPGRFVFLEVSDTGAGMDVEARERLFDPFFSTKASGRGLGLSAVLGIIRSHGATVELQTHPKEGTTLRVHFPADGSEASIEDSEPPRPAARSGDEVILIVDDESELLASTAECLDECGYTVITAEDGKSAIERFREGASDISAVILDLKMPDMDGEQVCAVLRSIRPDVPIVFATGYGEDMISSHLNRTENTGFVQKPYELDDLLAALRQLLDG